MIVPPVLALPLMAAINAFRGGRLVADEKLPGRNLYFAAPAVALVAYLIGFHPYVALAWGVTYLAWGAPSWGHLIGMGFHIPQDRKMPAHEQACMAISGGVWWLAFAVRELYILPGLFIIAWLLQEWWVPVLALPFALLAAGLRRLCWEGEPMRAIMLGEFLEGAVWGTLMAGVAYGTGKF